MPLNVLVVDAHKLFREGLCLICTDLGHEVDSVESGEAAIDKVREGSYGLVFMDYKMLGMDGIEATRRIREFDQEIPVYLVSATDFSGEEETLSKAGLTGYIDKAGDIAEKVKPVLEEHDK
jgi:CheY-like chemotaxis protein